MSKVELCAVHTVGRPGGWIPPGGKFHVESVREAEVLVRQGCARWPERPKASRERVPSEFPDDFPGKDAIVDAGITSFAVLAAVEDLTTIAGVGKKTAGRIARALQEHVERTTSAGSDEAGDKGDSEGSGEVEPDPALPLAPEGAQGTPES